MAGEIVRIPVQNGWKTPLGVITSFSLLTGFLVAWVTGGRSTQSLNVNPTVVRPTGVLTLRYIQRMIGTGRE
jgi:hypothetical protein